MEREGLLWSPGSEPATGYSTPLVEYASPRVKLGKARAKAKAQRAIGLLRNGGNDI
jgi:hypothetical protein